MERTQDHELRDEDIETIPPEPGITAPLDHVREDEKGMDPTPVLPGAEPNGARERASTEEGSGAADADTHDEPSIETSGTVDAVDATDPKTGDADGTDSEDVDGTDEGDAGDDAGDDSSGDVDGTDTGDDTGDDSGDADDTDSEDAKTDQPSS
jgi:hypothetical protein